ncbi:MAG: GerMN domain-containing protein [Fimbriimonadaceae bacterium]|nr:GerMN domain-containing protein [Fimbriimonadaceae bacterium]
MRRKTKNRAKPIALYALVLTASLAAGLGAYVKFTPADRVADIREPFADQAFPDRQTGNGRSVSSQKDNPFTQSRVSMAIARFDGDKLTFEESQIDVPNGQNSAIFAVNEFIKRSDVADGPVRIEEIKLDGKIALLYFNKAFGEQSLGSQDEATLLNGIRAVMGQFGSIDEVEFFSDGHQVDALGHIELIGPQKVIRPGLWKNPTSPDGTTPIEPQG